LNPRELERLLEQPLERHLAGGGGDPEALEVGVRDGLARPQRSRYRSSNHARIGIRAHVDDDLVAVPVRIDMVEREAGVGREGPEYPAVAPVD